jgi:hypothetical protein
MQTRAGVYDKNQSPGSGTLEMCRTSFRRKNNVDSARSPPQYLRKRPYGRRCAAVRSGPESEILLREKSSGGKFHGNEKEGEEEEALTNGSEVLPRIQKTC